MIKPTQATNITDIKGNTINITKFPKYNINHTCNSASCNSASCNCNSFKTLKKLTTLK